MAEPIEVTQADREAAAEYLMAVKGYDVGSAIRAGRSDGSVTPQAFARHRIAAERQAREAERAATLAHLRWWASQDGDAEAGWLHALIGQIEHDEHHAAAINARSTL